MMDGLRWYFRQFAIIRVIQQEGYRRTEQRAMQKYLLGVGGFPVRPPASSARLPLYLISFILFTHHVLLFPVQHEQLAVITK